MIQAKNLGFSYNKKPFFKDFSFELEAGKIYGLLGLNGEGKSTLLQLIAGALFAQEGSLEVLGLNPAKRGAEFLSRCFFLPETQYSLPMKGEQFLAVHAPLYPAFDYSVFEEITTAFHIPTDKSMRRMSLGQQKKFMLAFGLASGAELLLLDEPTNGLDIPSKSEFRRMLSQYITEDRCVIISTHQINDIDTLLDHILILHESKILCNQNIGELANQGCMRFVQGFDRPEIDSALYSESAVGGVFCVYPEAHHGEMIGEPLFDLEVYFNSIIAASRKRGDVCEQADRYKKVGA